MLNRAEWRPRRRDVQLHDNPLIEQYFQQYTGRLTGSQHCRHRGRSPDASHH